MTDALATYELGKRYGKQWALSDCSVAIPAGSISAVIGPNGAGKSTLLNAVVGLFPPTTGRIELFGGDPYADPSMVSRVGFVSQDRPLYRDFTVSEMLRFGASTNPRWDQPAAEARIASLGIPLGRKIKSLSGGQQAQVSLVLAIAKRAELIVLDEPVAALDPLARREFMQTLMDDVVENGQTVVFSSHLVGELERVCDHLVLLNQGRVQYCGALESFSQGHRLLVGPRVDTAEITALHHVIRASHTERQSTVLIRANGKAIDPRWDVRDPGFEEVVLAYLGQRASDLESSR
ncbi:MAG: ABC transporter ATP-binding protein [Thermomicrobiales bacterium]|nr:ABC transporter ATP-binding protein [Thermomicrobiales bacterium]